MKLTSKKFIALLLFAPLKDRAKEINIPLSGRTRLTKAVFLFEKECLKDFRKNSQFESYDLPEFRAWKYGPFSDQLYTDLEFLINREFVLTKKSNYKASDIEMEEYDEWSNSNINDENNWIKEYEQEEFYLSKESGIKLGQSVWDLLSKDQRKLIIEFKYRIVKTTLSSIIEYVYKKYASEGYIDKSLIKDRFL